MPHPFPAAAPLRVRIALLAIILLLPLAAGCGRDAAGTPRPEAQRLCEEGTADLQAFRFSEAADKLGLCLDLDPGVAEAAIARAEAFANLHDGKAAARELARADSLAGELQNERRRMLAQLRLSRSPSSRYHAIGDSLLDRLSRQDPDNLHVLVARAGAAKARGDIDEAVAAWQRVLEVNPNHVGAYNELGYLELNRARYDLALEQFQTYVFLAPELANPHDSYGEALFILGRYEEAEQEFRAALERQPDFYPSLINLGRTYLARGRTVKGEAILEKVRSHARGTEIERTVDMRILTAHLAADRPERVRAVSGGFVARYPKSPLAPLLRCLLLADQGRHAEGFAVMDSTLAARRNAAEYGKNPEFLLATEIYASQYEGFKRDLLGEPDAAVDAWAECIRLMEGDTPLHDQFFHRARHAAACLDAGRPDAALAGIATLLEVNPRQINVLELEVDAHLARGDRAAAGEALARLERALATADPDYPARSRTEARRARLDAAPEG